MNNGLSPVWGLWDESPIEICGFHQFENDGNSFNGDLYVNIGLTATNDRIETKIMSNECLYLCACTAECLYS